jgi:spore germination protein KC
MLPRDLFVGWSLVDNQFPKVTMDFSCPSGDGQFVVDVTSVHSQIRFQPASSGSMSAHVDIRVVGHVQGGMCVQDTSLARLHELEQAVARQVETMAQDSIRTCQKQWGVDIFGMGLALYRQHPGQWPGDEVWRNTFPRLQVDVHASARLDFAQTYQMSAAEVLS